jgi:membrane protease YdiL (CAAX protease family)
VIEVMLAFLLMQVVSRLMNHLTGISDLEIALYGWSFTGSLIFVLIPALIIRLTGQGFRTFGLTAEHWTTHLNTGMTAYFVLMIVPWGLGFGFLAIKGIPLHTGASSLVLIVSYFIATLTMLLLMQRQNLKPAATMVQGRRNMMLLTFLLSTPILFGIYLGRLTGTLIVTVIWQFFCSGFGEEFVWRGYVQTRLNQGFGRPWQILDVRFGPGLILASLLFGLTHAFNTYQTGQGLTGLSWWWAAEATVAGLFFGILREKTGTILASGIAHGAPDAVGEAFAILFGWNL